MIKARRKPGFFYWGRMDIKQAQFSIYDFLGYLVPGIFSIYLFDYLFSFIGIEFLGVELSSIKGASQIFPLILCSYVLGHLISTASSFLVERHYIRFFDYPSKALLGWSRPKRLRGEGVFANGLALSAALLFWPVSIFSFAFMAVNDKLRFISRRLDPLLIHLICRKITRLLVDRGQIRNPNDHASADNSDFFRFVYHFALENSPAHFGKMQNYVALFGFNRAMCFVFCVASWISLISLLMIGGSQALAALMASWVGCLFFFVGFSKFYRRFSLEALMAMAVSYSVPENLVRAEFDPRKLKESA